LLFAVPPYILFSVNRSELLAKVPLVSGLSDSDRSSLGERLVERRFETGQRIFDKGDAGASMFIIASGAVRIFLPPDPALPAAEQMRVDLRESRAGDHFGELALFDAQPRSASAEASAPTLLLELSREDFVADVVRSPAAVLAILSEVAQRLRDTTNLLGQRAAKDAYQEIHENLTWAQRLADRVAELNGSWAFIICLLGLSCLWSLANAFLSKPFDGYPYVFFNLLLGLMVALQGPLIMMSQNRQTQQDRAQSASDFKVNLKNEVGIETLLRDLGALRRDVDLRLSRLEKPAAGLDGGERPASGELKVS
jgi:CRP/FNR family transcriptional regulator, cyclic AMP receptor protein